MENPTPQQVLVARVNEFTICINILLENKHTLPALVLMYSAIDVFAALLRPETELDTSGVHFKKWAEDYLLGPPGLTIASEDLWGARCGLLHTHSPSSRVSRQGQASELHYYRARGLTPDMQRDLESKLNSLRAMGKLPVDVDVLYAAFEDGVRRFLADIQANPTLQKQAVHHSQKIFGTWTYNPSPRLQGEQGRES